MQLVFFILLFFLLSVLALDLVPQWFTWQSRIHIGRFADKNVWIKKVLHTSLQWLKKTPTIPLTDSNRLIIIDVLQGNYKRKSIQYWQEAALVLGLTACYSKTKDSSCKKEVDSFLKSTFPNGTWKEAPKEVDAVLLAYAVLNIDWIAPKKYQAVYDTAYQLVLDLVGSDGTVAYRSHVSDSRFVDTIGFICPFLVLYGLQFNKPEAIALAIIQITTFNAYGLLPSTAIPCHTYTVSAKLPVGLFGWGRGMGWYAIGLIDSWRVLPEDNSNKKILEQSVVSFATAALRFQNPNGSWSWNVLDATSRMDSSATATLAWFLVNAATLDSIATECTLATEKALDYLKSVTRRDGAVDFSQGDTKGIGVYSQQFGILPFTQGFCLRTLYADFNF